MLYAFPKVGRAGLGNLMIPWARCEVFRDQHKVPMLAPQWTQPKIGPLLRGERDKRYYVGLFNNSGYIRGLRKYWILSRSEHIAEKDALSAVAASSAARRVVVFEGLEGMLLPLVPHRELITRRVHAILSRRVRQMVDDARVDHEIGVHIRRGDKIPMEFGQPLPDDWTYTPSDQWYIACIENVRSALRRVAAVTIFSDATAEQLEPFLKLPNVKLAEPRPSIVDILLLARSRILITCVTSSFSMWASYLGRMPTLWYPGLLQQLNPDRPHFDSETDLRGNLQEEFVQVIRNAQPHCA